VGGGLTGVELAAEMAQNLRISRNVTLVEASPSLLPGLPENLQTRARRRLGWLGVNVLTSAQVTNAGADRVHLRDGSVIRHGLLVWAAGVKGHPLVADLGLSLDRGGRVALDQYLRCGSSDIYVLGDSATWSPALDQPPLPPSAQLAGQMGFSAAADLASRLTGKQGVRFRPRLRGVLCDLGGLNASGLVYRFQIHGLVGALAKRLSVLQHLWATTGPKGFLIHLRDRFLVWLKRRPARVD